MNYQPPFRVRLPYLVSLIVLTVSFVAGAISHAQDARDVITLGVPEYFLTQFKDLLVPHLEQASPDLRIKLVTISASTKAPDASWIDDYYKQINANVNTADILLVTPFDLLPEATRAGYFLDLKPLIDVDASLEPADVVPATWNAFQWDGSTWSLPALFTTRFLVYDPAAFDAAGLTYPTAAWTLDELAAAARQLTVKGVAGKADVPGLFMDAASLSVMFRALLGEPLYDSTALLLMPHLARPDLAAMLETWAALEADGSATTQPAPDTYDKIPLRVGSAFDLEARGGDQRVLAASLFPGGVSSLDVLGFAISKGTSQPDQSYQVLKALTAQPELRALLGGGLSARLSVQALTAEGEYQMRLTDEERAFVASTASVGLNTADLLFANYLPAAINRVTAGDDALTALQTVEAQATQIMQAAAEKHESVVVVVPTPIPDPDALPDGKIALTFGIFTGDTALPNASAWQTAVEDFIATDPQVGKINLEFIAPVTQDWSKKLAALPTTTDCFYPAFANVDTVAADVLSVDALMDADPDFSRDDVLNGVLRDLERDHQVKGFPLSITPTLLRYNKQQFEAAGLELPIDGWTIDQFASALTALKAQQPDQPVLYPDHDTGTYLFMLMAAYGVLPIDWRTDPVTISYTDPKVVDTIRQVLDLAKNDTIRYAKTAVFMRTLRPVSAPLVIEDFSTSSGTNPATGLTTFPGGTDFTPVTYGLNAAYISANTAAPDACYRWLKALAHSPQFFPGIPALRSVITDPRTEALYGADTIAVFQRFDQTLSAPDTIIVQLNALGVARLWLLRAFDNYVLKNADLEQELADAERFTKEYMACVTELGQAVNKSVPGGIYVEDKCSNKIDPTFLDIFSDRG